jgi:hypothetical protein
MTTVLPRERHSEQLAFVLAAVTGQPGRTAYQLSPGLPMPEPPIGELHRPVPMTLMLALLGELAKDGKVRAVPDPKGQRWYPAGGEGGT